MTKTYLAILLALLLAPGISSADEQAPTTDGRTSANNERVPATSDTMPGVVHLPEVTVEASRTGALIQDSPRETHVVRATEIDGTMRATSPDALNELPSVLVQKTNLGGGAPILRGLSGNRVLLLVDGIRLNNSTYRAGPNQYFNTVDPVMASAIQVIPGPGSVLFGSDAMGGVINVVGREPAGNQPNIQYNGLVSTADGSQSHAASMSRYNESAGVLVGGTIRDFNDLRSGSGVVQVPTAYSEWSAFGRFLWKPADDHKFTLSYQANRQDDVPRTDRVVSGRDSVNLYNPQDRDLAFLRYETSALRAVARSVLFTLSWNRQQEGREVISANKTTIQVNQFDDVQTLGAILEARAIVGKQTTLVYGGELYRDDVDSRGSRLNLVTGVETPTVGSFPDDGEATSAGAYLTIQQPVSERLSLSGSGRFSHFELSGTPQGSFGTVEQENDDVTAAAELKWTLGKDDYLFGGVSQGFRAPGLSDALALGLTGRGYDVPNPELMPEQLLSIESGFKMADTSAGTEAELTVYASRISDLIERVPTSYQGSDSLDGEPVFHQDNIGSGTILGLSAAARFPLATHWNLEASLAWTYGENDEVDVPLTRIPPLRGIVKFQRKFNRGSAEFVTAWADRQDRLSPEDLRDTRIPKGGTPGYVALHLRGQFVIDKGVTLRAGIENILDQSYRIHGSGIDMSGRNLFLGVQLNH